MGTLRGMTGITLSYSNSIWYVCLHILILLIVRRLQTKSPLRMKHRIKWCSFLDIIMLPLLEPTASAAYWVGWLAWSAWWYLFDTKSYLYASLVAAVCLGARSYWVYTLQLWLYIPSVCYALGFTYLSLFRLLQL